MVIITTLKLSVNLNNDQINGMIDEDLESWSKNIW